MTQRLLVTAALSTMAALALTACSAPAADNNLNSLTTEHVSLSPIEAYGLDIATHARGLERTDSGNLLLSAVASDHMSTTVHRIDLTEDSSNDLNVNQMRTAFVPQADDGGTPIANLSDEKLNNMARAMALKADTSATPEDQDPPKEPTSETTELYTALINLARVRGQIGFGLTQTHDPNGQRSQEHVWQLGAAGASTNLNLLENNDQDVAIDRPLRGLEGSIGACTVPADPSAIKPTTTSDDNPDDDGLKDTSSASLVTSSGTGALIVRDPVTTFDHSVIEATLPDKAKGLSVTDTTTPGTRSPERTVLLGLSELDCVNSDTTAGTDDHVAIFAAINTDIAAKALAHRQIIDAADEEVNDSAENTTLSTTTHAHAPTETGQVAIIDGGTGLVTTLADSSQMITDHPELADKDITSIAVDESSYHHTGGRTRSGQSWWQRLLPNFLNNTSDNSPQRDPITAWVTYEDTPTLYKVQF